MRQPRKAADNTPPQGGESREAPVIPPRGVGSYGDYDSAGVDLSLLRWVLGLTPRQRLELMERHARDTRLLYEYGRRHREAKAAANR